MQSPMQKYGSQSRPRETVFLEDAFPIWHMEAVWVWMGGSGRGSGGERRGGGAILFVEATNVDNIMSLYGYFYYIILFFDAI